MSTEQLDQLSDDELVARWTQAVKETEEAYKAIRLTSSMEADYNRKNYSKLASTEKGKAEYRAQLDEFSKMRTLRDQEFYRHVATRDACQAEGIRRGTFEQFALKRKP